MVIEMVTAVKCHVCGAEMTISAPGGDMMSHSTYAMAPCRLAHPHLQEPTYCPDLNRAVALAKIRALAD
jgi:hypothetical protein